MIKDNRYNHYTKKELIEELFLLIDNYNGLEWQINNQVKYINQNYIPIEWIEKNYSWLTMAGEMINHWREENEIDRCR